jgi:DNA topoisomerase-1
VSGLLWKKIRGKLSAGRVQSAAVKLIVEREREIKNFKPENYFKVTAEFSSKKTGKDTFKAELSENIKTEKTTKDFLEKSLKADFNVKAITVSPQTRKPYPPFTTSTLQQSAAIKLGFSVSRTMRTAQKLYEAGHITYMRTDSTNLSKTAIGQLAKHIETNFGKKYLQIRQYTKSSKNAQEAHEAIRPTYVHKDHVTSDSDGQKLYDLIRIRALSSQMADAQVEKTTIDITISNDAKRTFIAKGEIILFDGFLKLYKNASDEVFLPKLEDNQEVFAHSVEALERASKPPARYGEASLVKKLEELGIGRPSTYAPTIDKITSASRGYITKESRDGDPIEYKLFELKDNKIHESIKSEVTGSQKNKLYAQDIALLVTDFLDDHFSKIMNYSFTAQVEDKLDDVALGKEKWVEVVDEYYKPFIKTVESTLKKAERVTGERILGKDPKTKKTLLVRMSKFGPVAQIGAPDEIKEDEKPQYANLRKDQDLETITLDEALTLFSLPKELGSYKGFDVVIGIGRFGPFVKYGEKYVSIPKTIDPYHIHLKEAGELIDQKEKADAPIGVYKDLPITKGVGRFGPFVKWNNMYASINKKSGYKLETITADQAAILIKDKEKKEKEKYIQVWDGEKVSILKGRWGPFIKLQGSKTFYRLPLNSSGEKMSIDEAKKLTLEQVKNSRSAISISLEKTLSIQYI